MSLSFEEIAAQYIPLREEVRLERERHLRERQAAAQKISELQADPRWEVFGREVEQYKEIFAQRSEAAKLRLLNGLPLGDEYVKLKFEQAQADASFAALSYVMRIAKTLIEQGEKAIEELKNAPGQ